MVKKGTSGLHSKETSQKKAQEEEKIKENIAQGVKVSDYGEVVDHAPELINTPSANFVEVKRGSESQNALNSSSQNNTDYVILAPPVDLSEQQKREQK